MKTDMTVRGESEADTVRNWGKDYKRSKSAVWMTSNQCEENDRIITTITYMKMENADAVKFRVARRNKRFGRTSCRYEYNNRESQRPCFKTRTRSREN